ncbi:MAG: DUF2793 domain-containing protein [Alphaproteobacteria bacterium]
MVQTTRLQLPLIAAAQAQKHVTHNEAILRLDGLCQMQAVSYTVSAQPASPADGDLYLLPAGKTGSAWGGAANHAAAHYYDGVWHFYAPRAGWIAFITDMSRLVYHDGTAWTDVLTPSGASAADGGASAPGFAFASDTNTGLYRIGADQIGITTGGTLRRAISTTAETPTLPQQGQDGSAGTPAYGFSADTDSGLYRIGANNPGIAAGGSLVESWAVAGITRPLQPAFFAYLSAGQSNKTGDGTAYDVPFDSELFDRGSNHDAATTKGVFTAPVTGLYLFGATCRLSSLGAGHTQWEMNFVTTGNTFVPLSYDPHNIIAGGILFFSSSVLVPMTAGDTCKLRITVYNSTKTVAVDGGAAGNKTKFWGFLVA